MRSRPTQQTIRQAQDAWRSHEASTRRVSGYAIVFGKLSLDLGGFVEVIARSAPARSLQENKDIPPWPRTERINFSAAPRTTRSS